MKIYNIILFMDKGKTIEKSTTKIREKSSEKRQKKTPGLLEKAEEIRKNKAKKIIIKWTVILIVAFVFLSAAFFGLKKFNSVKYQKSNALIQQQLILCQELISAKFRYSDIVVVKKSMGFSKSYSIVKYSGLLRAGIGDISKIDFDLSKNGKSVTVKIPKAEILGNDLIEQEVFDEKQSIFVPITTQEIFNEIEEARRNIEESMIEEGFLDEARASAIKIISQTLHAAGFEEVKIN